MYVDISTYLVTNYTSGGKFNSKLNFRRTEDKRRNIQRSHLLVATVTFFILCWLPMNILNIAEDFDLPLRTWRYTFNSGYQLKD